MNQSFISFRGGLRGRRRLGALALLGIPLIAAAARQVPTSGSGPLSVRVEVVNVEVSVTDARGNFLRHLKRENFRVLDDGLEQPIKHFASEEAPAVVLVVVETSPAVYLIHRQHLEAAHALLDGLAPDDRVALASYDQSPRLVVPLTPDKLAVRQGLGALRYNLGRGQLHLFDALAAALDWLAPHPGKKAVVLLSTGLDTSGRRWESLAEKLCANEVTLYPIALGGELRDFRREPEAPVAPASGRPSESRDRREGGASGVSQLSFDDADRNLRQMAELTGGRAYFPRRASDFAGIYQQIALTLRHRYTLGFAPPVRDARFHKIEVQVLDARGRILAPAHGKHRHRIHARRGYLAPVP